MLFSLWVRRSKYGCGARVYIAPPANLPSVAIGQRRKFASPAALKGPSGARLRTADMESPKPDARMELGQDHIRMTDWKKRFGEEKNGAVTRAVPIQPVKRARTKGPELPAALVPFAREKDASLITIIQKEKSALKNMFVLASVGYIQHQSICNNLHLPTETVDRVIAARTQLFMDLDKGLTALEESVRYPVPPLE